MPQLLWIGCFEDDEEFKIKASKGYDLASAQVSQKNLILGIEKITGEIFDSINGSPVPSYPLYKDRIVEPVIWEHSPGAYDISVGYKNDEYINRLNCRKSMIKAIDKWVVNRYKGGELVVFAYSMCSASMATACRIKSKVKNAKIYLIVTDLPQFMDLNPNKIKAFLKKIDWIGIKKMQRKFDGFILYAEKMAEYLKIESDKWMLMEGSYDVLEKITPVESKKKAIMYSGKLDERYGIPLLIDAFMKTEDPEVELWLTGGGSAADYIRKCAKEDKRIKFYGFLENREEVISMQSKASVLINMRMPSEEASKYCFPSKLFEYMATGIPVLTFDILGIPKEYKKHLYFIKEETVESIIESLNHVVNLTDNERIEKGRKAQAFILNNKNSYIQSKKIWDYVNEND